MDLIVRRVSFNSILSQVSILVLTFELSVDQVVMIDCLLSLDPRLRNRSRQYQGRRNINSSLAIFISVLISMATSSLRLGRKEGALEVVSSF